MPALEIVALDESTPQLRAPDAADTYLAPRALAITPPSLTGAAATSSLAIAQTWNTSGTPTALDLNVTDTASNAAALLVNLRVGGASRFSFRKDGYAIASLGFGSFNWYSGSAGLVATVATVASVANVWNASNGLAINSDVALFRDAANTLALRNGTNAQGFNLYNTFTDASNLARLRIFSESANQFAIIAENLGTGAQQNIRISSPSQGISLDAANGVNFRNGNGSTLYWTISAAGILSSSVGTYFQMTEMVAPAAPAVDRVRIYAEDNGAGKTRLMARFATGAAQQIAIEP